MRQELAKKAKRQGRAKERELLSLLAVMEA